MSGYLTVLNSIQEHARAIKRDPRAIALAVVSKNHTWKEARAAYDQGCRLFAENRVQDALEKIALAPKDIEWHFIGTLQKNKVAKVVGNFSLIHSVDSVELAEKIAKISQDRGFTTNILLQVNTTGEASKHGLSQEEWKREIGKLLQLSGIKINGFMTMAPLVEDEKVIRKAFEDLRIFRDEMEKVYHTDFPALSMGMSHDYKIAIDEGATIVRIGTAVFLESME